METVVVILSIAIVALVIQNVVLACQGRAAVRGLLAQLEAMKIIHDDRIDSLLRSQQEERRELCTRIQAWDPNPSRADKSEARIPAPDPLREEVAEGMSFEELAAIQIKPNTDGGFIDMNTDSLYETVADLQEWRSYLRKHNLPMNTNPESLRTGAVKED